MAMVAGTEESWERSAIRISLQMSKRSPKGLSTTGFPHRGMARDVLIVRLSILFGKVLDARRF